MVCKKTYRLVFLLFVFSVFSSCENDPEAISNIEAAEKLPLESMIDGEIFYTDSAKIVAKLKAKKIDHYFNKRPYTVMPRGINVEFYNSAQQPETKMQANYAIKYDDLDIVEARGNVIIINEKGDMLNTEHIIWDEKNDKITTKAAVKITTAKEVLFGDGLESNQSFTKYKILKLRGSFQVEE
jgi:LPS export ABC transporter protein LptC